MAELNLDVSQELNITTRRGDSMSFTLQFKDSDGELIPISDLEGTGGPYFYEFIMEVRDTADDDDFTVTPSDGVLLIGATQNYLTGRNINVGDPRRVLATMEPTSSKVTFFATSAVMRGLEPGKYAYDIEVQKHPVALTNFNSPVTAQTWIRGTFTVVDDVTVTG